MNNTNQENYEYQLILKVDQRFNKFVKELKSFDLIQNKIAKFLKRLKRYISGELYKILFSLQFHSLAKTMLNKKG
jgi:hypothetical protein